MQTNVNVPLCLLYLTHEQPHIYKGVICQRCALCLLLIAYMLAWHKGAAFTHKVLCKLVPLHWGIKVNAPLLSMRHIKLLFSYGKIKKKKKKEMKSLKHPCTNNAEHPVLYQFCLLNCLTSTFSQILHVLTVLACANSASMCYQF